jgi:outer membrane protein OmpA-like peptidoglycan-associated protein
MTGSLRHALRVRRTSALLLAVLAAACATQPPAPAPGRHPVTVAGAGSHSAVTATPQRAERVRALLKAGVVPLKKHALAKYLDGLEARLRASVAGNTAEIARSDGSLVVTMPARALFAPDAVQLTPVGEKSLSAITEVLRGEHALVVEAACHTDRLGVPADNESFTQRRADLVRDTLAAGGLEASHLIAVGSGDRFPVADNATEDGRRQNRRLELTLIPIVH